MTIMKSISTLFLTMMLVTAFPISTLAASFELSASAKNAFDKLTTTANSTSASLMNNHYSHMLKLQQQGQEWDTRIKDLHYTNEETLIVLKKQIQLIDSGKITALQTQLTKVREQYKPLFSMYESLNQQKAVAKKLNNKEIYKLLLSQTESMKIAVQLARSDIRNKESSLTTAKSNAAKTKKTLRSMLDPIAPLKVQIKAAKNDATTSMKRFTSETSTFKQSIKNGTINPTLRSLESLVKHIQKVVDHKQRCYSLEQQITEIMRKVKLKIN